ncbi:pyridoxamine 5'-phosphate oxidase [Rubripirellula amarantea]|nr:pyridoxamine 5'-phosphate oxidase [Rubripirellula amarantea]
MSIHSMRKTYTMGGLSEKDVDSDPLVQFQRWFGEAELADLPDWVEINAMTVSTSTRSGAVSSRILLLKGIEDGRFLFYTNYLSAKGEDLADNPVASLCFYWPHLQRQVRVEGKVTKTSRQQSEDYFHSRPRESQLGANVSEQSTVVTADQLDARMKELQQTFEGKEVPCPEHWGGYAVEPMKIEFWQGRPSRLHDRILYQRDVGNWNIVRLAP